AHVGWLDDTACLDPLENPNNSWPGCREYIEQERQTGSSRRFSDITSTSQLFLSTPRLTGKVGGCLGSARKRLCTQMCRRFAGHRVAAPTTPRVIDSLPLKSST